MPAIRYPNANENSEQSAFVPGGLAANPDGSGNYVPENISYSAMVTVDADLTQKITVTAAGTPVQGPAKINPNGWLIRALPTNTGYCYVMFHGQTKANKGFPFDYSTGGVPPVKNLSDLDFDADANGSVIIAIKL
jgi:hypothetical protein